MRNEIHVVDEIVFRNSCIIIPTKLRQEILNDLHEGHMGITRSKNQAKGLVFWPNMSTEITKMSENCKTCLKYRNSNVKEPLLPHEMPTYPWEKVGMDLFEFEGDMYLMVVDYYSKFFETALLSKNTTSARVITNLKSIFSRHGIPLQIVGDNGPQLKNLKSSVLTGA